MNLHKSIFQLETALEYIRHSDVFITNTEVWDCPRIETAFNTFWSINKHVPVCSLSTSTNIRHFADTLTLFGLDDPKSAYNTLRAITIDRLNTAVNHFREVCRNVGYVPRELADKTLKVSNVQHQTQYLTNLSAKYKSILVVIVDLTLPEPIHSSPDSIGAMFEAVDVFIETRNKMPRYKSEIGYSISITQSESAGYVARAALFYNAKTGAVRDTPILHSINTLWGDITEGGLCIDRLCETGISSPLVDTTNPNERKLFVGMVDYILQGTFPLIRPSAVRCVRRGRTMDR